MSRELTGNEQSFSPDDVIVSKTDTKGIITYANNTFMQISGYEKREILGKPHNIIRNPFMPRAIFKLLWDRLKSEQEIFAYVVNRCKNGDYYWVFAHVTPSLDVDGTVLGYHSSRRVPERRILDKEIIPLYKSLNDIEDAKGNPKDAVTASYAHLNNHLSKAGVDYDRFIFSL